MLLADRGRGRAAEALHQPQPRGVVEGIETGPVAGPGTARVAGSQALIPAYPNAAITASVISTVSLVPPRSGVRMRPPANTLPTAPSISWAALLMPKCSTIWAAHKMVASGFTI